MLRNPAVNPSGNEPSCCSSQPNNLPLIQADFAEIQKLVRERSPAPQLDSSSNKIIELKEITNSDR